MRRPSALTGVDPTKIAENQAMVNESANKQIAASGTPDRR
jgi:hypothetical protein